MDIGAGSHGGRITMNLTWIVLLTGLVLFAVGAAAETPRYWLDDTAGVFSHQQMVSVENPSAIDGLAASAASVIAMAGTKVCMSPVAMLMIHNPATVAIGDEGEMQKAIDMLAEVKESIMNAYEIKTGLSRTVISHLMDAESWFNAKKAVELHFADEILFSPEEQKEAPDDVDAMLFSRAAVTNSLLSKLIPKKPEKQPAPKVPISQLDKRLSLLAH